MELADLLDATEVAVLLGLTNWRGVSVYRRRYADFPAPIIDKGRCMLWQRSDILAWAHQTGRLNERS